jgi:hypothetical protein
METIFIIKNFKRTKDCVLTIKSIRHFCDNEINVLHLFNESIEEYKVSSELLFNEELMDMGVIQHFGKTKYNNITLQISVPGNPGPANGLYYSEALNYCSEIFKGQNKKVIILDENHFFTSGETIKFLLNNDYDFAYGTWGNPFHYFYYKDENYYDRDENLMPNCSLLGINFLNLRHLFPIQEQFMFCEPLINQEILTKITDKSRIFKIPTRVLDNYCGDGFHTNDYDQMYDALQKSGIV